MIDYWYWTDVFNKKDIKLNNKTIDSVKDLGGDIPATGPKGQRKKFVNTKRIAWPDIKSLLKNEHLHWVNAGRREFGFEVFDMDDKQVLNYNTYSAEKQQKYDWHTDYNTGNNYWNIKLTVLINLSEDNYKGGEFEIFNGDIYEVKELNKPGNIIMFKSFLNHRVKPVLSGTRKTLTIFIDGPSFK